MQNPCIVKRKMYISYRCIPYQEIGVFKSNEFWDGRPNFGFYRLIVGKEYLPNLLVLTTKT